MNIKDLIKTQRIKKGISQKDIAEMVGVSEATVCRWESGNIANMRRDRIAKLAAALDISPLEIMGENRISSDNEKPATISDDELNEINLIFSQLSPDNRPKLLELARLYLEAQRNNKER